MIAAVESYLAVRRAVGFTLSNTEYLLRSFATFATDRNQTHIRTATAIDWAGLARSVAQRHTRYQTVCRFAQYLCVEDSRHEAPPPNHFWRENRCWHVSEHVPLRTRLRPRKQTVCKGRCFE